MQDDALLHTARAMMALLRAHFGDNREFREVFRQPDLFVFQTSIPVTFGCVDSCLKIHVHGGRIRTLPDLKQAYNSSCCFN